MSNGFYRLNIRFDLTDERQRLISEKLQSLDRKQYGSINKFIIAAIGNTLDGRSSDTLTAEEVRSNIHRHKRLRRRSPRRNRWKMNRAFLTIWKCSDDAKYADYGSKMGTDKILWH